MRTVPRATARKFHLAFDPDFDPEESAMKFRITYEGRLEGIGSADHKHEIRKAFHPQLRRFWMMHPNLKNWAFPRPPDSPLPNVGLTNQVYAWQALAHAYDRLGYHFVPLATENHSLVAAIDILFL